MPTGAPSARAQAVAGPASAQYSDQDEPQHGGVTNWNTNSEYSFELVVEGTTATVYVEDHEVPVPTESVKGTLSVTRDGTTKSADLLPAGENRMVARGLSISEGRQGRREAHAREWSHHARPFHCAVSAVHLTQ